MVDRSTHAMLSKGARQPANDPMLTSRMPSTAIPQDVYRSMRSPAPAGAMSTVALATLRKRGGFAHRYAT